MKQKNLNLAHCMGMLSFVLFGCASGLVYRAQTAYEKGQYQQAEILYQQVIKKSSAAQHRYNLALTYLALGQEQRALQLLEALLRKYPNNVLVLRACMVTYFSLDNYPMTEKMADRLLALNPYNFLGRLFKLYISSQEEQPLEALQALKALYKETEDPPIMLTVAQISYRVGQRQEAIFWMQKFVNKQGKADDYFHLADWYLEEKQYFKAADMIHHGLALADDPSQRFRLAKLHLLRLQNKQEGFKELKRAIESGYYSQKEFENLVERYRLGKKEEIRDIIANTKSSNS